MAKILVHKNKMMASVPGECEACDKTTWFLRSVKTFLDQAKARCSYCGETFDLKPDSEAMRLL